MGRGRGGAGERGVCVCCVRRGRGGGGERGVCVCV